MTLLLQSHLRCGGTIQELADKFAIKTTRHKEYPNLVLFKYNQIDSPFAEPLVRECRGIILDENNDWNVVSFPFTKFFNYGEGHAAEIDWNSARVMEKVDGSLSTIYYYDGAWRVATSGTPDASGKVNDFGFSFHELFWKTFEKYTVDLSSLPKNHCFIFELTSQYNRIVVRHAEPSLTLLGARNIDTLQELTVEEASKFLPTIPAVRTYLLNSFEEILETFPSINPLSQEGYVIVDKSFNRVKCKSPAYVSLHHMAGGLASNKGLLQIVVNGEIEEIIASFPEYKDTLIDMKTKFGEIVSELNAFYETIKHHEVQKDFAIAAQKCKCAAALFAYRAKKSESIHHYIRAMKIDHLLKMLGYKEETNEEPIE